MIARLQVQNNVMNRRPLVCFMNFYRPPGPPTARPVAGIAASAEGDRGGPEASVVRGRRARTPYPGQSPGRSRPGADSRDYVPRGIHAGAAGAGLQPIPRGHRLDPWRTGQMLAEQQSWVGRGDQRRRARAMTRISPRGGGGDERKGSTAAGRRARGGLRGTVTLGRRRVTLAGAKGEQPHREWKARPARGRV